MGGTEVVDSSEPHTNTLIEAIQFRYVKIIKVTVGSHVTNLKFLLLVAYAQIDWHDFVVVETVDYQPFEHGNFPPPTTPDEVGARVLMQVGSTLI